MFFRGNFDDPASRLIRDLVGDVRPPALPGVVHQQEVHDGIRALRGFDGFLDGHLASKILRVGNKHKRLAPGLGGQSVSAGHPDRIVHMGSIGAGRKGARRHHGPAGVDLRVMDGALQLRAVLGKIGEKVYVKIERDHHGLVAFA